jgi:hypothetical protein
MRKVVIGKVLASMSEEEILERARREILEEGKGPSDPEQRRLVIDAIENGRLTVKKRKKNPMEEIVLPSDIQRYDLIAEVDMPVDPLEKLLQTMAEDLGMSSIKELLEGAENHHHDCDNCGVKDECFLPQAQEYRKSLKAEGKQDGEGLVTEEDKRILEQMEEAFEEK